MPDYPKPVDGDLSSFEEIRRIEARHEREHIDGLFRLVQLLASWLISEFKNGEYRVLPGGMLNQRHLDDMRALGMERAAYNWCHDGTFNLEQIRAVCEAYNGKPCRHDHETPAALEPSQVEGE